MPLPAGVGRGGLGRVATKPRGTTSSRTRLPITYQDYLQLGNHGANNSEGAGSAMPEFQWNNLSDEDRFNTLGGNVPAGAFVINKGDPRYDEWFPQVGGEEGRPLFVRQGSSRDIRAPNGGRAYVDPNRIFDGDGFHITSQDNETPAMQDNGKPLDLYFLMAALAMAGGAAAGGAFSGAAGTQMGAAAGQGFGTALGTGAGLEGVGAGLGAGALGGGEFAGPYAPGMEQIGQLEGELMLQGIYPGSPEYITAMNEAGYVVGADGFAVPGPTQAPAPVSSAGSNGVGIPPISNGGTNGMLNQLARQLGPRALTSLLGLGNNSNGTNRPNGGSPGMGTNPLLDLLGLAGSGYMANRDRQSYREDINNMISVGTGGVTNEHRAGARNLVTGLYDGSISGDEIFNRVPGLRAISERGAQDIARRWSATGESDAASPNNSHAMREWVGFNNELTSKAWDQEMKRALQVGGFNIDPSIMASGGMRALGDIYSNRRQDNAGLMAGLNRLLSGGGGNTNDLWSLLGQLFRGGNDSDNPLFRGDPDIYNQPEDPDFGLPSPEDYPDLEFDDVYWN